MWHWSTINDGQSITWECHWTQDVLRQLELARVELLRCFRQEQQRIQSTVDQIIGRKLQVSEAIVSVAHCEPRSRYAHDRRLARDAGRATSDTRQRGRDSRLGCLHLALTAPRAAGGRSLIIHGLEKWQYKENLMMIVPQWHDQELKTNL